MIDREDIAADGAEGFSELVARARLAVEPLFSTPRRRLITLASAGGLAVLLAGFVAACVILAPMMEARDAARVREIAALMRARHGGAAATLARIDPNAPLDPDQMTLAPEVLRNLDPAAAKLMNDAIPLSTEPNPAAAPFHLDSKDPLDVARATDCMTAAIYYEAANQGAAGEAAIAQVVINRMRHPAYPKTICGVVFQGSGRSTGCQFTFTCDGSLARPPSQKGWAAARAVATAALNGAVYTPIGHATHYHTVFVVPYWNTSMTKVATVGAHVFFRWNGTWGLPPSFRGVYVGGEPVLTTAAWFTAGPPTPALPPGPKAMPEKLEIAALTPLQPMEGIVPAQTVVQTSSAAAVRDSGQAADGASATAAKGQVLENVQPVDVKPSFFGSPRQNRANRLPIPH